MLVEFRIFGSYLSQSTSDYFSRDHSNGVRTCELSLEFYIDAVGAI